MSLFIALAAAITLLTLIGLVRPLWRQPASEAAASAATAHSANVAIYRDQLQALDAELAQGLLTADEYQSARDELQLRMLDDTENTATPSPTPKAQAARPSAWILAIALPLLSAGLYTQLGNTSALDPARAQRQANEQVQEMVQSLEAKLVKTPDNHQGWAMLARSYKVMGRTDDAIQAYEKALPALQGNADLLVDFAELLAIRAGNQMGGRPTELVEQALAADPENPSALMLLGVAAYQREDFDGAVREWEKLLSVVEPGSEDAQMTQENLDDARARSAKARAGSKP